MIPLRLSLSDFLSYRQASLDFRGLHTACICGANGAGKSSLLEAITWVLWGQSRVLLEDDVIHGGASEVAVDLIFASHGQTYRVIRRRYRQQATVLEFQVAIQAGDALGIDLAQLSFRSLTAKGVRATQARIIQTLKLDYETFVNSAYLRQGRADELMLKRPSERKQVLADLLQLGQYEALAEQAKERVRSHRAETAALDHSNQQLLHQLAERESGEVALRTLEASLAALQQDQRRDYARQAELLTQQQQHQHWQQQSEFAQQQRDRLLHSQAALEEEQADLQQQQQQLQGLLSQSDDIVQRYHQWQQLQQQEAQGSAIAQEHRALTEQLEPLRQQLAQQQAAIARQQEQLAAQEMALAQQRDELMPLLAKAEAITAAWERLKTAKERLQALDSLEAETEPLRQRQHQLAAQQQQEQARLRARLDEIHSQAASWEQTEAYLSQVQGELEVLTRQVNYLEMRRQLQEQIRDKGLERRGFLERLIAHKQDYESQITTLDGKVRLLNQPGAVCSLCDRPLDDKHLWVVQGRQERDRQALLDLLIVVRDQILVTEREIDVLRAEYHTIEEELKGYGGVLERRGQLQQQLAQQEALLQQQRHWAAERDRLQACLAGDCPDNHASSEWQQLTASLLALGYDDRSHALARGEVERWRWADLKHAELKQAQRRLAKIADQALALQAQQDTLTQQLRSLDCSPQNETIQALNAQLIALDYDPEAHAHLQQQLRAMQSAPLDNQALEQAHAQAPKIAGRLAAIAQQRQQIEEDVAALNAQLQTWASQLALNQDLAENLATLTLQLQQRRQQLDGYLAEQGRLQQRQQQLAALQLQYEQQLEQQQRSAYQQRIHQELAQAFGKSGIQALLIENLLPQLERETNRILSRLSEHQLQVQFITQKAKRKAKGRNSGEWVDTLDIRIGDAQGTRPYETYSGGEAFRVNFSIRLALARLLSQRSGTPLQLLIVDEGFGTQDGEGCDRLIGAINAIASDFACILTITHMPQFKEAFQARIEVSKGLEGSTLTLAV